MCDTKAREFEAAFTDDLGFGRGSVAGVKSSYGYRGFHRPGLPTPHRRSRDVFNLRPCKGPYACNYDPEPCREEEMNGYVERNSMSNQAVLPPQKIMSGRTCSFILILSVLFLFLFFNSRRS